jgi:hypothetical protein
MPRTKTKRVIFRVAGFVGLAGLAWLGNHAGHYMARGGWFQGDAAPGKTSRAMPSTPERVSSGPVKTEEVASVLRRLRAIAAGSPNLMVDFEAEAQVDTILAKLSAGELAAIYAEIDAKISRGDFNVRVLIQKTGLAWVALDPTAAMTAAAAKSPMSSQYYASSMFGEWAADSPEAAFAWLNGTELPAALAELKDEFRRAALMYLGERDFDLATAEFLKMGEKKARWSDPRGGVLSDWAHLYVDEPGMRERLVEFAKSTGKPEDYAKLNDSLLRQWTQDDPLGMLDYLQGLKGYLESDAVPAEKRPEVDATAVGAAIYREYTRPALEWWMERYSQSTATPQPMREAIGYWVHQRPGELQQWFAEQPESPQRDGLNAAAATSFTANSKFQEAAQRVEQITDPKIRQSAVERLNFVWAANDAQAAAAWRATQ